MLKSRFNINFLNSKIINEHLLKNKTIPNSRISFIKANQFNFSTNEKLKNVSKLSEDLFQKNFQFNTPPENMISYNDMDMSMASEVFKRIDLENLSTLPLLNGRFSRLWCFIEDSMHHFVMFITHDLNLGIGSSIIILAAAIRLLFYPVTKRHFKNLQLSRMLYPEMQEFQEKIKKLRAANERKLLVIENKKLKQFRESYGIKSSPVIFLLTLAQGMLLCSWAGLVQRFSFNIEDYPEMMTGGLLWFKDLSMSDPYFILPIINSVLIMLNIYSNNGQYSSPLFLKIRRILFIPAFASLPIMCTIETGIVLYITVLSSIHFLVQASLNNEKIRRGLGVYSYLPGSKLEKLNKFRLSGNKFEETNSSETVTSTTAKEVTQHTTADKAKSQKEKLRSISQQRKKKKNF